MDKSLEEEGSIARRVSIRGSEDGGKSLYVSKMQRLYGCWGLKIVAFGNLYFLQYSSDGEPHNLNILCSCSTWSQATQKLVMYHPENNTNFKRKKKGDIGPKGGMTKPKNKRNKIDQLMLNVSSVWGKVTGREIAISILIL